MNDDLNDQLDILEQALAHFEEASKRALGFVETINYRGISFNVSKRFVIADLSPLAFFHLVEQHEGAAQKAVVRLYHRLYPLLSCKHQWTRLKRASDGHVQGLGGGAPAVHICKSCTAYSLGEPLPTVGRNTE